MGSGTDVARESAQIMLLGNDLVKFVETVKIARRCNRILFANFAGTLLVDGAGVGLAAFGFLNPLLAAFIQVSSELAFILNSARLPPRNSSERAIGVLRPRVRTSSVLVGSHIVVGCTNTNRSVIRNSRGDTFTNAIINDPQPFTPVVSKTWHTKKDPASCLAGEGGMVEEIVCRSSLQTLVKYIVLRKGQEIGVSETLQNRTVLAVVFCWRAPIYTKGRTFCGGQGCSVNVESHHGNHIVMGCTRHQWPREYEFAMVRLCRLLSYVWYADWMKTIDILLVLGALVAVILWFYYRPTIEYLSIGSWKIK